MEEVRFGERLRLLRERRGLGVRELGRATGINHATLSQAENGKRWVGKLPSYEDLSALARVFGITVDELVGNEPAPVPSRPSWLSAALDTLLTALGAAPLDANEIALDQVVSAGKGKGVGEDVARYRPKQQPLYVVKVEGDCMVPEVESGDSVRFDPELVPEDGDWVVATIDGDRAVIKEYRIERGVQRLLPLNGEPLLIDENVRIVGVVLEVGKPSPRTRRRQRRVRPVSPKQRPLPGT